LSPFTWEAFASLSGDPSQKAEKRSLIEKEIQEKSIFGYKLICSFLLVFTASLIVFYLLFFLLSPLFGKYRSPASSGTRTTQYSEYGCTG